MKSGEVFQSEEIMLPGNKTMRSLNVDENENYKYLGVLEADDKKHIEMSLRAGSKRNIFVQLRQY